MRGLLSIANALVTTVIIAGILIIGVTALTNSDVLWFVHSFNARAESITIYWDGNQYELHPNDQTYEAVMTAFTEAVEKPSGFEWEVGFSEENIARYREDFRLLEVTFPEPVQVHTRHPFPKAKTYLVPLDKTHASWRRVFAFPGLKPYTSGPLNISPANFDVLVSAVEKAVTLHE